LKRTSRKIDCTDLPGEVWIRGRPNTIARRIHAPRGGRQSLPGLHFQEGGDLNSEELRTAFDEISQKLRDSTSVDTTFDITTMTSSEPEKDFRSSSSMAQPPKLQTFMMKAIRSGRRTTRCTDSGSWYSRSERQIGEGTSPASPLAVFRDWMEFSRQAMEYPLAD